MSCQHRRLFGLQLHSLVLHSATQRQTMLREVRIKWMRELYEPFSLSKMSASGLGKMLVVLTQADNATKCSTLNDGLQ